MEIILIFIGDGIVVLLGYMVVLYEKVCEVFVVGVRMVIYFFNVMFFFGYCELEFSIVNIIILVGNEEVFSYGIIVDGVYNYKLVVMLVYLVYLEGLILVMDVMYVLGLGDGMYLWWNGIEKLSVVKFRGRVMVLKMDEEKRERMVLVGSVVMLLECVNNFLGYIDMMSVGLEGDEGENEYIVLVLMVVMEWLVRLLGLEGSIGILEDGMDGDIVVLERVIGEGGGGMVLKLREVWK